MSIRLMTKIWDDSQFRGTELIVLLCLADHANDEGICWPSYDRIAERCRISRRQSIRYVARMIDEGWIQKVGTRPVGKGGFVNILKLTLSNGVTPATPPVSESVQRGDISGNDGVTFLAKGGDIAVSPKPSLEPPKEPSLCRADALRWDSSVSLEDAHDHVLAITGLNPIHAVLCSQSWLKTAISAQDWRESLSGFASSFERKAAK